MSQLECIDIGGYRQWISVRGRNGANPIMLFLHGGPGSAQIAFTRKVQSRLEKEFIVVNWDQRGAGKSFSNKIKREDMTVDHFLNDTEEVVRYLLHKFGKEKLFLVGHSWGSFLGIQTARRIPELLHAYIGIGQVLNVQKSEEMSYRFTLDEARRKNNRRAIRQLTRIGKPPYEDMRSSGIQRRWLDKFGGSTFRRSMMYYVVSNLTWKDTSVMDIIRFMRGSIFSLRCLDHEVATINIENDLEEINTPVFLCAGRHDYTVPSALLESYFPHLPAKQKEIIWFERSGHLPNFEEPDKFCDLCIDIKASVFEASAEEASV